MTAKQFHVCTAASLQGKTEIIQSVDAQISPDVLKEKKSLKLSELSEGQLKTSLFQILLKTRCINQKLIPEKDLVNDDKITTGVYSLWHAYFY